MRVPVRRLPETRVSERQQGFARAAAPLDVSPLTEVIEGFRNQLLDEQDARQRVDLNRRLIQEVNELQSDFVERQRNPEVSSIDFADSTNTAYTDRHSALLDELRRQDYSEELLEDFETRLGTVRQGFLERGLTHQLTQLRARAVDEIEDLGVAASQYAAANPDGYATAREMVRDSIRTQPDLTEAERDELEDQQLAVLRDAGARALAIQNPQMIIDTFDPQGLTAPYRPTAVGATPTAASGWQGVATSVASELGLDPVEVAAVISYETAGTFSPTIMGGTGGNHMGLIQFGQEERQRYEITETSTPEEWTTAILNFMRDRGFRRGMSLLDFYSTINAGSPGRHSASDGPGNTVRTHVDRLLREHRAGAERWLGAATLAPTPTPVQTASIQTIDLPPSQALQQSDSMVGVEAPAPVTDIGSIRTGNALLDDLNGVERLQLLAQARERMNQVTASQRAEMDVRIGNITAEAIQNGGEIATAIPTEQDVLRIYGPVEGPQRWAQIQQSRDTGRAITTFRTQSATDIQRSLDALEPTPGSPTYETELQIYQAAERAAAALLTEREADPAAYAMRYFPAVREAAERGTSHYYAALDRVYETLGINPDGAPVMSAEAAGQLAQQYRDMTSSQRQEFMRQNMSEMGEARFRRFVRDMEGTTAEVDARIFALLRTYPGRAGNWRNVYNQILEGREYIAQDPARRPNPQQVLAQFREYREAVLNLGADASRAIQEAAEGLYVQRGGDPVNVRQSLYREALATALGGNLPVQMGSLDDYTILPPGTNRQQFESWIERQTWQSLTEMSVERRPARYGDLRTLVPTEDIVDEGVFVMVSPGRYMIKMAGDGRPLMTSTGRPFLVNINPRNVVR